MAAGDLVLQVAAQFVCTCCIVVTLPFFSALLIPDVTWQPESPSVSPECDAYLGQYEHEAVDQSGHTHL